MPWYYSHSWRISHVQHHHQQLQHHPTSVTVVISVIIDHLDVVDITIVITAAITTETTVTATTTAMREGEECITTDFSAADHGEAITTEWTFFR